MLRYVKTTMSFLQISYYTIGILRKASGKLPILSGNSCKPLLFPSTRFILVAESNIPDQNRVR